MYTQDFGIVKRDDHEEQERERDYGSLRRQLNVKLPVRCGLGYSTEDKTARHLYENPHAHISATL